MGESAMTNKLNETRFEPNNQVDQYDRIEFSINGLVPYLFKVWNTASMSMTVLVKEGSDILSRLNTGDTLPVKCYLTNSVYPPDYLETAIRHISKNDQGRLKGHYLVNLEVLKSRN